MGHDAGNGVGVWIDMKAGAKEVMRRLAAALIDSNEAVTVHDLKGNIVAWNRGAERMYGYTEAEALKMNTVRLAPPNKKKETVEYLSQLSSGERVESFETQRVCKDGRVLDVWLVLTYLKDDSGAVDSIAATERDITEIKHEQRIKDAEGHLLKGLLPMCASCNAIRDEAGCWHRIESFIQEHSEIELSHGLCPRCAEILLYEKIHPVKLDKALNVRFSTIVPI